MCYFWGLGCSGISSASGRLRIKRRELLVVGNLLMAPDIEAPALLESSERLIAAGGQANVFAGWSSVGH